MIVLGILGSPRENGNTDFLLSKFMEEAESLGARTRVISAAGKNITPCKGDGFCNKDGYCRIKDDMKEVYQLFREADAIVVATPVFFYSAPAGLKALIDRAQALWVRKYILKLNDPCSGFRKGFLLALGATKGKNLFEGLSLTMKYFFDAAGASFEGSLTYRRIEHLGDMEKHPTVLTDVKEQARKLLVPLLGRKQILFACRDNACRSQMASAFAQRLAGDRFEVLTGGSSPAGTVDHVMVQSMQEKGVDMAFKTPKSIEDALSHANPEIIVTLGCGEQCPAIPGARILDWDLPDPAGRGIEFIRNIRDAIEDKVTGLVASI